MASGSQDLCEKWSSIADHDLTAEHVQSTLKSIKDDLWVVAACVDRILDDVTTQRDLLDLGLDSHTWCDSTSCAVFDYSAHDAAAVLRIWCATLARWLIFCGGAPP